MAMHRHNKCRGAKRGFDLNPETGKYDKPRPILINEPWFNANCKRVRMRRDMAIESRRANRGH
jgi:hypothetical protein